MGKLHRLLPASAAALLLTACFGSGADQQDEQQGQAAEPMADQQQDTGGTEDEPAAVDEPEESEDSGEEIDDADADSAAGPVQDGSPDVPIEEAIASIEYEVGDDASITASVVTLEEVDGILLMEVLWWPHPADTGDRVQVYDMIGRDGKATRADGPLPRIYDRENLKVYRTFHHNNTVSAAMAPSAAEGEAVYWWGYFPPLEDDVEAVDIQFVNERPHLEDVPVP